MFIIDTDMLSLIQRGDSPEGQRIVARIEAIETDVYVTIISFEEQVRGWLGFLGHATKLQREVEGYARLYQLIEDFQRRQILLYTTEAAERFRLLRRFHRRTGAMDLKIAAIALANDATSITRNRKDFHGITGLELQDWTLR